MDRPNYSPNNDPRPWADIYNLVSIVTRFELRTSLKYDEAKYLVAVEPRLSKIAQCAKDVIFDYERRQNEPDGSLPKGAQVRPVHLSENPKIDKPRRRHTP